MACKSPHELPFLTDFHLSCYHPSFAYHDFITASRTCKIWPIFRPLHILCLHPECSANTSPQIGSFPGVMSLFKHLHIRFREPFPNCLWSRLPFIHSLLWILFHSNSISFLYRKYIWNYSTYLFTHLFIFLHKNVNYIEAWYLPAWLTGICLPPSTLAEWVNEENRWVVMDSHFIERKTDILTE